MSLRVVRSFRQWWAKAAPTYWQQEADVVVVPTPPTTLPAEQDWTPTKPWARWLPQPQCGWQQETDIVVVPIPPATPTPGDATAILVVAYYERWSGKLAQIGWQQETDAPAVVPPAVSAESTWQPTRPWARWLPQPQLGWQEQGGEPSSAPAPTWQPTKQWARWQPQAWQGWQQEGDRNPSTNAPAVVWGSIRQWERWKPQPQVGWQQETDSPAVVPPAVSGESTWQPIQPWARWRPQPQLGWQEGTDTPAIAPPAVSGEQTWQPTRPWARWKAQPSLGWQEGTDTAPLAPPVRGEPSWQLRPYLFKAFTPQPWLGWQNEGERNPSVDAPPVAWASVRQWQRWKPQPQRGWSAPLDGIIPPPPTPPSGGGRPFLFGGYRRQPWLGWNVTGDRPEPIVPALHPYLLRGYRPQPWLGWALPGIETAPEVPPVPPGGHGSRIRTPVPLMPRVRRPRAGVYRLACDALDSVQVTVEPVILQYFRRLHMRCATLGIRSRIQQAELRRQWHIQAQPCHGITTMLATMSTRHGWSAEYLQAEEDELGETGIL
jgi:hypothetical protein